MVDRHCIVFFLFLNVCWLVITRNKLRIMIMVMVMTAVTSSASDVTMTSRGHMIFVHVSQSVTLDCQFHAVAFSLFDNPVVWKKTQRDEETQINIMSNIVEPFLSTNRLSVSFAMDSPVYRMSLRIRGTVYSRTDIIVIRPPGLDLRSRPKGLCFTVGAIFF